MGTIGDYDGIMLAFENRFGGACPASVSGYKPKDGSAIPYSSAQAVLDAYPELEANGAECVMPVEKTGVGFYPVARVPTVSGGELCSFKDDWGDNQYIYKNLLDCLMGRGLANCKEEQIPAGIPVDEGAAKSFWRNGLLNNPPLTLSELAKCKVKGS